MDYYNYSYNSRTDWHLLPDTIRISDGVTIIRPHTTPHTIPSSALSFISVSRKYQLSLLFWVFFWAKLDTLTDPIVPLESSD